MASKTASSSITQSPIIAIAGGRYDSDHAKISPLSPPATCIDDIPPEILATILLACLDTVPFLEITKTLLQLCTVCSSWRRTARSHPILWTRLAMPARVQKQEVVHILKDWFMLAGALPLSLGFGQAVLWVDDGPHGPTPTADTANHWPRLKDLEISVPHSSTDSMCLVFQTVVFIGSGASSLEKLVLQMDDTWSYNATSRLLEDPRPTIAALGSLRKVVIKNGNHDTRRHRPLYLFNWVPWKQLTHLSMSGIEISDEIFHGLLRLCSCLQQASFTFRDTDDMNPYYMESASVVSLPSLISLTLISKVRRHFFLLQLLSLPSLRTLSIGAIERIVRWSASTFMKLDARRTLQTLILSNIKISSKHLIRFLKTTPALKTLILDIPIDYASPLKKLSTLHRPIFLPRLQKLSLYQWNRVGNHKIIDLNLRWYVKILQDIRKARVQEHDEEERTGSPLEISLYTRWKCPTTELIEERLRSLRHKGLVFTAGIAESGYRG